MYRKIVVGVQGDDEHARDAIAFAQSIARPETELVIAAIWVSPLGAGDPVYGPQVEEELEREAARLRDHAGGESFVRTRVVGSTSVARGLHHLAEREGADLLVVAPLQDEPTRTSQRGVALGLLHDCPCAVAVAPEGLAGRPAGPPQRIVVAWDGSPEAQQALECATRLAEQTGAALRAVHVVELPQSFAERWVGSAETESRWLADLQEGARRSIEDAVRQVGERVPVDTEIVTGLPGEELARAAEDADLMVMGSRRYGTLKRLVLGSTSAIVMRDTGTPVLVIPRGAQLPERDAITEPRASSGSAA